MKVTYFILGFLIWAKFETLLCKDKFPEANFLFVNGRKNTDNVVIQFNNTKALLQHPDFNQDRDTVLYCHGYTENFTVESTQVVVDAYLSRNDHNILVVQWSAYSAGNYVFQAIPNSIKIGAKIGKVLVAMQNIGFKLSKFHIVGHSLGKLLIQ